MSQGARGVIVAWFGAILVGVSLGLLGSGGAILTVPILVYLVGRPEKVAIAESLAVVGSIALVGAIQAALQRRLDVRNVLFFGVPGMAGSAFGAWLAHWIPGPVQLILLAIIMLAAAAVMYRVRVVDAHIPLRLPLSVIALQGIAVGAITGLVGVGGGFLIIPALVLLGGVAMHTAVGTSLAIIALNCGTAFLKYQNVLVAQRLNVDWRLIGVFAALGVAGSLGGGFLAARMPQRVLRRVFAFSLVVLAAYMLWQQISAMTQ